MGGLLLDWKTAIPVIMIFPGLLLVPAGLVGRSRHEQLKDVLEEEEQEATPRTQTAPFRLRVHRIM